MIWNKYPWLNLFHKEVFSGATSSSRCRINPVYHYSFPNWNYSILQMRIIPELDSFEIRLMPTASEVCIKLPSSESLPHRTVGIFFEIQSNSTWEIFHHLLNNLINSLTNLVLMDDNKCNILMDDLNDWEEILKTEQELRGGLLCMRWEAGKLPNLPHLASWDYLFCLFLFCWKDIMFSGRPVSAHQCQYLQIFPSSQSLCCVLERVELVKICKYVLPAGIWALLQRLYVAASGWVQDSVYKEHQPLLPSKRWSTM